MFVARESATDVGRGCVGSEPGLVSAFCLLIETHSACVRTLGDSYSQVSLSFSLQLTSAADEEGDVIRRDVQPVSRPVTTDACHKEAGNSHEGQFL